jgi:ParB/RepB/Spo0J family partition protein
MKIPIDKIRIPSERLSAKFTPEQEAFFKASIAKLGVIHEPVVRRLPDGTYEVIAGAHRIQELKNLGQTEIECKVVDADDKLALEMNLIENIARGEYDPVELSKMLNKYVQLGASIDDIAKLTGHRREWVEFYLALDKLPDKYKQLLSQGILKVGHIEAASQLPSPEEMAYALDLAADLKWTVSTLQYYVERRLQDIRLAKALEGGVQPPPPPTPEVAKSMVDQYECSGCKRIMHKSTIRCPPICDECYTLLRYCTDQFGPPRQAMGYIYQAVQHYQTFLEAQQRYFLAQQQAQVLQPQIQAGLNPAGSNPALEENQPIQTPSTPQPPRAPAPMPEKPQVIEDNKLREKIKTMIKEVLKEYGY